MSCRFCSIGTSHCGENELHYKHKAAKQNAIKQYVPKLLHTCKVCWTNHYANFEYGNLYT